MGLEPKVVPLRNNRPPHQDHPDWVAFKSVLRSLWALEDMPISVLAEDHYSFFDLGNDFSAEQMLDEIDMSTANIRVKLSNHRNGKR